MNIEEEKESAKETENVEEAELEEMLNEEPPDPASWRKRTRFVYGHFITRALWCEIFSLHGRQVSGILLYRGTEL